MLRNQLKQIIKKRAKVLVIGLGISGIESALFFSRVGVNVTCVERETREAYERSSKYRERLAELEGLNVGMHFGVDGEKIAPFVKDIALCVLSPGVSLESAITGALKRLGVPLVSELELGIELLGWPSIVVTGSNGKSTTVSLVHAMLREQGFNSRLCGNVGFPVVSNLGREDVLESSPPEDSYLVVEASSYQIETCSVIKPKVAALLNVSDNHLERHGTLDRYLAIKARIFENQDAKDFALINADDARVNQLRARLKGTVVPFGLHFALEKEKYGACIEYNRAEGIDKIYARFERDVEEYDISESPLLGLHNRYDIAAALLAARLMGASSESIQAVIENFHSLEHRIEVLQDIGDVKVINDSKATTVAACFAAVQAVRESYPDAPLVLLIGGLAKAGSWEPLMALLRREAEFIRALVCFGQDGKLLASSCRSKRIKHHIAENLKAAVTQAFSLSSPGDVVLLSPGCASFDEFVDFEQRGRVFKTYVQEHAKNE